jgi:hypothetical protein
MCACPPLGMCTVHGTRHTQRQGGQVSWAGTPVVTVAGLGGWVSNKRLFKTTMRLIRLSRTQPGPVPGHSLEAVQSRDGHHTLLR